MQKGKTFLLEEMNGFEIKKHVNSKTIAVLIFGACENHGDHLSFGSDFIFPLDLAKRISLKSKNLIILPPLPYGVSIHHKKFFMTISIDPNTFIKFIDGSDAS